MSKTYSSTWLKMRDLVILSLNIIYIKDNLQHLERLKAKMEYMNFSIGPLAVMENSLNDRKRQLNRRVKALLEEILNSKKVTLGEETDYSFVIETEHSSLTKKQLEKGYALFANVRDKTYALSLRNGALLPIIDPENNIIDHNLSSLEFIARHEGPVYDYFEIDMTNPLQNNLRY